MALGEAYRGDTLGCVSVGGSSSSTPRSGRCCSRRPRARPDAYRTPPGVVAESLCQYHLQKLEEVLTEHHRKIAAVIIEPLVQGAAGMIMHPTGYLRGVRELTRKYDVLMIADEVAVGFGRTGRMFACEHEDVSPDLFCIGKGMTGGYLPVAATLATDEIWQAFLGTYAESRTFYHGHTYGGNPLGAAAALATLDVFEQERTLEACRRRWRVWTGISPGSPACPTSATCGVAVGLRNHWFRKSYTIRGGEGKKRGLALRSAELLLTIIEKQRSCVQIKVSVAAIFNDKAVDLLPPKNPQCTRPQTFMSLESSTKIAKKHKREAEQDKIHMVIVLRLYQDFELLSEAYFVELAGSEYAREDKQVARSFNSISSQLTQNPATKTWQTDPLCAYLHKALDIYGANPCSVLLICCASQGIDNFKDTLASLKFTSRIKECIGEGAVRPEIGQIDGFLHQRGRVGVVEALGILESIEVGVKKLVAGDRVCEQEGGGN